jgi:hypothetical protein
MASLFTPLTAMVIGYFTARGLSPLLFADAVSVAEGNTERAMRFQPLNRAA